MKSAALHSALALFLIGAASGCTDYWWHRSQPPSVETLLSRSEAKLAASLSSASSSRQEVADLSKNIEKNLKIAFDVLKTSRGVPGVNSAYFAPIEADLIKLDGKLAVTSRAPYSELCGQFRIFRNMAESGERIRLEPFGLFAARTISFLASELTLAAPVQAAPVQAAAAKAERGADGAINQPSETETTSAG